MFNAPSDIPYVRFLTRLHIAVLFDWYMEIGCRKGRSFAPVRGKTIAVDPFFRIKSDVMTQKPALFLFQQTSDDFFDSKILSNMKIKLGFSFLDGMHLMEYLLRDFMNTEANSDKDGVIAMHDCCPYNLEMTTRDLDTAPRAAWTGDVWKLIPILQKYRPDLKLTILGCKPTGLVFVSNLNPKSKVLINNYDKILAEWQELTLAEYGVSTFYDAFDYTPTSEIVQSDYAIFDKVRIAAENIPAPEYVSP